MAVFGTTSASFGLTGFGEPTRRLVSGASTVGQSPTQLALTGSNFTWACGIELDDEAVASIDLQAGTGSVSGGQLQITVGGTLSPNAAREYEQSGTNDGRPFYSSLDGARYLIAWYSASSQWKISDTESAALWYSDSDVATPDLATGWTPGGGTGATGTPTTTGTPTSIITDASGIDFEGKTLPEAEALGGFFLSCAAGSADLAIDTKVKFPLVAGDRLQFANSAASEELMGTLTITATAPGTKIDLVMACAAATP